MDGMDVGATMSPRLQRCPLCLSLKKEGHLFSEGNMGNTYPLRKAAGAKSGLCLLLRLSLTALNTRTSWVGLFGGACACKFFFVQLREAAACHLLFFAPTLLIFTPPSNPDWRRRGGEMPCSFARRISMMQKIRHASSYLQSEKRRLQRSYLRTATRDSQVREQDIEREKTPKREKYE